MRCPQCESERLKIVNSHPTDERDNAVTRQRKCLECQHLFFTVERIRDEYKKVTYPDGSFATFSLPMVACSLVLSCPALQTQLPLLTKLVTQITRAVALNPAHMFSSEKLKALIVQVLLKSDKAIARAYIRSNFEFASEQEIREYISIVNQIVDEEEKIIIFPNAGPIETDGRKIFAQQVRNGERIKAPSRTKEQKAADDAAKAALPPKKMGRPRGTKNKL